MQARLRQIMDHLREDIKRSTSRSSRRCSRPPRKFWAASSRHSRITRREPSRPGA